MKNLELKLKDACKRYMQAVVDKMPDHKRIRIYYEIRSIKSQLNFI